MSAETAINRLLEHHPKGFDLTLDRIRRLLGELGNPEARLPPVFHIAGTNGKGSTAAFIRATVEAASETVHVHTSPHLVRWHERYRIGATGGGKLVSDAMLEDAVNRAAKANSGRPITVFEIMSAVAFLLFSENPADYAIFEVGLGGRFDATNVIESPLVTAISPISLDHQSWLGSALEKIAFEKAGIIKSGCPAVIGEQEETALEVIKDVAASKNAPLIIAQQDFDYYEQGGRMIFQDEKGLLDLPLPRLRGHHQLANAALAIAAIRMAGIDYPMEAFETAMATVSWPGRFERLKPGKLAAALPAGKVSNLDIWIDGGHNPQAGEALARELAALEEQASMPLHLIAGMLTSKDPAGFFSAFAGLAATVTAVPVRASDEGYRPDELAKIAAGAGLKAGAAESVLQALTGLAEQVGKGETARILICGSLYLIGDVLRENGTPPE